MKLAELFNNGIMDAADDFVIIDDGRVVVDNRDRIDDSLTDYYNRDVKRMYYSEAAKALKIKLQERGFDE